MILGKIITTATITTVGILVIAAILPALFPAQEVYAPSARRGYFQAAAEGTIFANMNPYASPYMIVVCDDLKQLETVYTNWKLQQQQQQGTI